MGDRLRLGLVSLWLLLSSLFNVETLRLLIRDAFRLFAGLYAGLDRWRDAQFILTLVFVLGVIVLLLSGAKLGRTLAVVLLLGSCCTWAGEVLLKMVFTIQGYPHHYPPPMGWVVIGAVFVLNLACLRALTASKRLVRPAQTLN